MFVFHEYMFAPPIQQEMEKRLEEKLRIRQKETWVVFIGGREKNSPKSVTIFIKNKVVLPLYLAYL